MKKDYLDIVDEVVMKAFKEGFVITCDDLWGNYAVKARLELYGYKEGQRYYLNELGIRYVMDGCSEGIKRRQAKDEYINDLNIEATRKAMNDADRAFVQSERAIAQADKALNHSSTGNRISWFALVVAIVSAFVQILEEPIKKLLSLLCQLM